MRRTTISLPDHVATALEREAARRRLPVSQIAREAIEARLGMTDDGPRFVPFIGIADSGRPSTASEEIDAYLGEHLANDVAGDR